MDTDSELETWRRQWRAHDVVPQDLRRSVERGTRHMRFGVAAEIAVTVVMGGGSALLALMSQRVDAFTLAIGIWIFIAIAWAWSLTLRRDIWKPAADTNAAFLDLSILRCRRRLQAVAAQCVLYVMILAFDLTWIYYYRRGTGISPTDVWTFLTSGSVLVTWVVTAILAAFAAWYRTRLIRELRTLQDLRQQLHHDFGG